MTSGSTHLFPATIRITFTPKKTPFFRFLFTSAGDLLTIEALTNADKP